MTGYELYMAKQANFGRGMSFLGEMAGGVTRGAKPVAQKARWNAAMGEFGQGFKDIGSSATGAVKGVGNKAREAWSGIDASGTQLYHPVGPGGAAQPKGFVNSPWNSPAGLTAAIGAGAILGPHIARAGRSIAGGIRGLRGGAPAAAARGGALTRGQQIGLGIAGGGLGGYLLASAANKQASEETGYAVGAPTLGAGAAGAGMYAAHMARRAKELRGAALIHGGVAGAHAAMLPVHYGLAGMTMGQRAANTAAASQLALGLLNSGASRGFARAARRAKVRAQIAALAAGGMGLGALGLGVAAANQGQ